MKRRSFLASLAALAGVPIPQPKNPPSTPKPNNAYSSADYIIQYRVDPKFFKEYSNIKAHGSFRGTLGKT
jgi:hypothetical protein